MRSALLSACDEFLLLTHDLLAHWRLIGQHEAHLTRDLPTL